METKVCAGILLGEARDDWGLVAKKNYSPRCCEGKDYIYIYVHTHIHVCIWYIVYNMYTQKIYYTIIVTTNFLGPLVPQFWCIAVAPIEFWQVLLALAKSPQCESLKKDFLELSVHFDLSFVCSGEIRGLRHHFWIQYGYGSIPIDTFLVGWTSMNPSYFGVH